MFTGIIQAQGRMSGYRQGGREIVVRAGGLAGRIEPGGSLAVDGVCLTLVRREAELLVFGLSRETRDRTTLGALRAGRPLNLELPLTLAAPLGGHLVSGHVDYKGRILRVLARPPGRRISVTLPPAMRPFFVAKGSAAVDGVSLTVAAVGPAAFDVELIPATLETTNLGRLRPGAEVNVECDMIGKYVYNFVKRPSV
ncbi:MAG: riboflavin synthase [Candidatus Aminicenantes bacterium]|nr:riboflavin synthase [Candidatus Aminicenantes bacterium]